MNTNLYRHSKGGLYRLIGRGRHSETQDQVVIYQSVETNYLWVRPAAMWVEEVVWPDGVTRPRFVPEGTVPVEDADARPREANGT